MPVIETAITRLLQIKHPILLAPMGSASGGRLAAAVTHAGGLGIIGSGYADSAAIKKELTAAGNARVGIGLVTWALDERPEALDTALAAHPPVLMLSFGSPVPFADAIKRAGCLLMCQSKRWLRPRKLPYLELTLSLPKAAMPAATPA